MMLAQSTPLNSCPVFNGLILLELGSTTTGCLFDNPSCEKLVYSLLAVAQLTQDLPAVLTRGQAALPTYGNNLLDALYLYSTVRTYVGQHVLVILSGDAVLRIRDVYPGSEFFPSRIRGQKKIPDPGSSSENFSIFHPKNVSKLSEI
jgi:hypothetical protein